MIRQVQPRRRRLFIIAPSVTESRALVASSSTSKVGFPARALALPTAEVAAILFNRSLVTAPPTENHIVNHRILGSGDQMLLGQGVVPETEVIAHATLEQDNLLIYHRQGITQNVPGHLGQWDAIEQNPPALGFHQARQ